MGYDGIWTNKKHRIGKVGDLVYMINDWTTKVGWDKTKVVVFFSEGMRIRRVLFHVTGV